ncbi:MAG: helix-turn-helix domain-containing protein [Candidatus Latescibacter sp.]|nr:helix-turn-helix domain-containing protein [Candidatus Latescibacter sp.]
MPTKEYITIPELAKLLGVSRITIYNRVKKGEILAEKIGRIYIITDETIREILGKKVTTKEKKRIEASVRRTVREYGDVLKKLGRE